MEFNLWISNLDITNYKALNPETEKPAYRGKVNVKAKSGVEEEKRKIIISIQLDMLLNVKDDDGLGSVGTIETESHYIFKNLTDWDKHVTINDDQVKIDERLDEFLVNISYNNTRGLLRERGKNDLFGQLILPLMDPKDIKREDF